ncbi:MAG TPA: hypothetical protein VFO76_11275, partial [Candidatus Kapabacteria bacterium]|nr:hypothetical protein [Candidatus Kapabacteria bacterium]
SVWSDEYNTDVKDGLFNILLGSGKTLPSGIDLDQLYLGVKINGTSELRPLTQIASATTSITVADNSITKDKLATDYVAGISINGKKVTGKGSILNIKDGIGMNLQYDEKTHSLSVNSLGGLGNTKPQAAPNWDLSGNALTTGIEFLGSRSTSTASTAVEIHVDDGGVQSGSGRVMRYELVGGNSPNITGGFNSNSIFGNNGSTIAGGGSATAGANQINNDYCFIGSGEANFVAADWSSIVGGTNNAIWSTASAINSLIGGGGGNTIAFNGVTSDFSSILGGSSNAIDAADAAIIGGFSNGVTQASDYSWLGGGNANNIENATYSVLGGGQSNGITGSTTTINYDFLGGGHYNHIYSSLSTIGGGDYNTIQANATEAVIGGGYSNNITGSASDRSSIVGGDDNTLSQSEAAIIGGGKAHNISFGHFSGIFSGESNTIAGVVIGDFNNHNVIGGGELNGIQNKSTHSGIVGGYSNSISDVNNATDLSFIGGGQYNSITKDLDVIVGGDGNQILNAGGSNIVGGTTNTIQDDGNSSIVGGSNNLITNWGNSFIGGGTGNTINGGGTCTISGGSLGTMLVGGGQPNVHFSTIGGGALATITGPVCTIPGGWQLTAQSFGQTVIGAFNRAQGTTSAATGFTTASPTFTMNDRLFIIGNGTSGTALSNAFEVSNNGHSIVYDQNGNGVVPVGVGTHGRADILGATYRDNTVNAWGSVTGAGTIANNDNFGVARIEKIGTGCYKVWLNVQDPLVNINSFPAPGGAQAVLTNASITATLISDDCPTVHHTGLPDGTGNGNIISVSAIQNAKDWNMQSRNFFEVMVCEYVLDNVGGYRLFKSAIDNGFMFKVVGRVAQ